MTRCAYHDPYNLDCAVSDLAVELVDVTPSSGCGIADGSIEVSASGGKGNYTYQLGDAIQTTPKFESVLPGIYSVIVNDWYGCEVVLENVSVQAEGLSFSALVGEDSECLSDNGTVTIEITEGNPPYEYSINDEPFGSNNVFENLPFGDHQIRTRDVEGCIVALNVTVPRGLTGTSWSAEIEPIMAESCALSGCHNGLSRPDLRIYANAKKYSFQIKALTQDRSMPFDGPPLQQSEIDHIACWVDDGALEN